MCGVGFKEEGGWQRANPPPTPAAISRHRLDDIAPNLTSSPRHWHFIGRKYSLRYAAVGDIFTLIAAAATSVHPSVSRDLRQHQHTLHQTTFFFQPETRYLHQRGLAPATKFRRCSPIASQDVVLLIRLGCDEQSRLVISAASLFQSCITIAKCYNP